MNVPKIRYDNFTKEWEKVKLSSQASFLQGLTYTPNDVSNDGTIVLRSSNIQNSMVDYNDIVRVNIIIPEKLKIKENDILMCVRNGSKSLVGKTAWLSKNEEKCTWGAFMNIIRPKEKNKFVYYYLNSKYFYNHVWKDLGTATVNQITKQTLESCYLNIPSIEEQEKISNTLSLLDQKIKLQSKKIEDLKLFKKGLNDKLFNEVTGNDYLLSDIAVFENGKGHENIIDENGKYILINSKFISTEGNVTKKCSEQLTPLFKNDITMVMSDLPNGKALAKCYYIDENNKYSLNQRICKIKVKDDSIINSKYLFYLLNRNSYYLRFDDGVNQTNLKKDDILSLNLVLPSIKEQERDSKTLTIIDNFIEKENNKLSKLILLKKGLMQSMFV